MTSSISTFRRPLRPRDPHEPHRAATPLELFTDLCFVVAIAQAAAELHHAIAEDHLAEGATSFTLAFFAIWWAWLNFTWFASAYDNDDVPYRLFTLLQIVGSLALAAGIGRLFDGDYTLVVLGYVTMRIALVAQWLRVAAQDRARRTTARRYAIGITVLQVLWVLRLSTPEETLLASFAVLAVAELLVPAWAERAEPTSWHPHHIAERYGLFFIIMLGETILSATFALQEALTEEGPDAGIYVVVAAGVLIVFSMWWIYFARDHGSALAGLTDRLSTSAFTWGFGHFFVFGSAAAVGAGLAARVEYWTHHSEASAIESAAAITVPVAVWLVSVWLVCLRRHDAGPRTALPFLLAAALVLLATVGPVPELVTGLVCAALLAVELRVADMAPSGPAAD